MRENFGRVEREQGRERRMERGEEKEGWEEEKEREEGGKGI